MHMNTRIDDFYAGQVALLAYRYAQHYGGHVPMLMVAQVFVTRYKKGWGSWPTILQNHAKSAACVEPPTPGFPDPWNRNFLRVLADIDGIMNDTGKDPTNSALYFGDTNDITNPWFSSNICQSPLHQRVADTGGTLTFWS